MNWITDKTPPEKIKVLVTLKGLNPFPDIPYVDVGFFHDGYWIVNEMVYDTKTDKNVIAWAEFPNPYGVGTVVLD